MLQKNATFINQMKGWFEEVKKLEGVQQLVCPTYYIFFGVVFQSHQHVP